MLQTLRDVADEFRDAKLALAVGEARSSRQRDRLESALARRAEDRGQRSAVGGALGREA